MLSFKCEETRYKHLASGNADASGGVNSSSLIPEFIPNLGLRMEALCPGHSSFNFWKPLREKEDTRHVPLSLDSLQRRGVPVEDLGTGQTHGEVPWWL